MKLRLLLSITAVCICCLTGMALRAEAGVDMPPVADRTQLPEWPEPAVVLHVAPNGAADAAGTVEKPFAALAQARGAGFADAYLR